MTIDGLVKRYVLLHGIQLPQTLPEVPETSLVAKRLRTQPEQPAEQHQFNLPESTAGQAKQRQNYDQRHQCRVRCWLHNKCLDHRCSWYPILIPAQLGFQGVPMFQGVTAFQDLPVFRGMPMFQRVQTVQGTPIVQHLLKPAVVQSPAHSLMHSLLHIQLCTEPSKPTSCIH